MVRRKPYVPCRGDLVWIDLDPQAGHEQAGRRPAVVVSAQAYNGKAGLALFCPITSSIKGYPFEVVLPPGLPISGAILADQVKSLDWRERKTKLACAISSETLDEVLYKIDLLLKK